MELQSVGFSAAKEIVRAGVLNKVVVALIGSPGVGKTSLMRELASELKMELQVLIASNMEATDVAGLPWVDKDAGCVRRQLFSEIETACRRPVLLFIDEASTMGPAVQAPMMRLILDRKVGDGHSLHPDTRVVLALNPPDECPGGIELSAAVTNRLVLVRFCPPWRELFDYFMSPREDKKLERVFKEFAATSTVASLFEMTPPEASIQQGAPWGSPRAWETGLKMLAQLSPDSVEGITKAEETLNLFSSKEAELAFVALAGAVGPALAVRFLSIRGRRKLLPSVLDIIANPTTIPIPEDKEIQIAAIGLVLQIAEECYWAAWLFTDRLLPEIKSAIAQHLLTYGVTSKDRKTYFEVARPVQTKILNDLDALRKGAEKHLTEGKQDAA